MNLVFYNFDNEDEVIVAYDNCYIVPRKDDLVVIGGKIYFIIITLDEKRMGQIKLQNLRILLTLYQSWLTILLIFLLFYAKITI